MKTRNMSMSQYVKGTRVVLDVTGISHSDHWMLP